MAKVLIIESESSVADELTEAFKQRGADTIVTGDGAEALTLARDESPALIVLCVELSRGSGYSVCNKLKKDVSLASIPLILTSSQATEETFEQHRKLRTRAEAYLKKPYDLSELMEHAAKHADLGSAGAADDDFDVSLIGDDESFEVGLDDDVSVDLDDADDFDASLEELVGSSSTSSSFSSKGTGALVADAQSQSSRAEVRELRQKVKRLETTLQEKELEFNDRLLEESARARGAVDIKKKLSQVEREVAKYKQAAERATAETDRAKQEAQRVRLDVGTAESERENLSDKIGQLVDKVKTLAAERERLHQNIARLEKEKGAVEAEIRSVTKVREKAKKAIDIAVQLLDETGLVH